ncbi:MAG: outer membrane protein, partial [Microcystaceae cyanobacterium]
MSAFTQAELQAFAEGWYKKLDVHAPVEEITPLLAADGLKMVFPEATLEGLDKFIAWYQGGGDLPGVINIFFDEVHEVKSVELTGTGRAIMINAYYDFPVSEQFRPYIGAGIGTYNARINDLSPPGFGGFVANGDSADRFAFQLRAGISYLFTPNFEVFTGYRYFHGEQL